MFKFGSVVTCFTLISLSAYSQQQLKGRVLEYKTRESLVGITVQNLSTKQTAVTDIKGWFALKARINDLLVFKGFAYQNDTLLVTRYTDMEVFLQPQQHVLQDVKVTSMEGPSLIFIDPNFHGQKTAYQTDGKGNLKGGLIFRFWYWKKDERRKKRYEERLKKEEVSNEIAKTFSAKNLATFIPLQGNEMEAFSRLYRPSIKVYQANSFVLSNYLNACYKKFIQLSPEKRQISIDSSIFVP